MRSRMPRRKKLCSRKVSAGNALRRRLATAQFELLEARQMLSGSSWAGPDWEVVETPAGPTIHWDGAWAAPGTEEVSSVPPSADTYIDSAAPEDTSAGVRPILYVGNGDWQGSPSESQGLLQFDVSDLSHDVSQATVTLTPDAWRVGSESHAAEAIFDHAWDETTTWITQPDIASASPISLTSGEATWTIANGDTNPIQLDVTRQVREALRRGDLNFDGVRGAAGVLDDVAAFELAMQDPTAFDTAFAPAIVDDRDLLDRADLNDDGVINRDDAPSFLAAHGFQPGDLDFDGTLGLADLSRLQRKLGQDASYTQGDVDFSEHVDRRDAVQLIANFGAVSPTAAEDKLSMRIYATDYLPGDSPYVGYVSKDNLSTPDRHPQLSVIEVAGDPYEQVAFGPAWQTDRVGAGAAPAHQAIAVDGAGTSTHAWLTDAAATPSIVARQFDARGDPLGEPFTIISGDGVTDARVAAGASGDFVVAWRGPDPSGSTALFYRRYRMIGTAPVAGETVQVTDSNLSANHRFASVTLNDDRTVAFLWQGATVGSAGETDVYFRAFDAEDQPAAASPVVVHETVVTTERQPAQSGGGIATLPGERFAVVWTDGRQLQLRRFDADGSAVAGSEEILGSAATIDGTLIGGAKVVSSVTGDLSVAWWQQSPSAQPDGSPETTIRMRRFDVASGSWQPATTLIDFRSPFWQSDSGAVDVDGLHIAADLFGSLGVAWQQSPAGSPTTSFVQWFSRDGEPITAPTVVSSSGSSHVTGMASGTGGRFLIGWNTEETTYARTIHLPWTPEPEIAAPTLQDVPEQVVDIGGTFTADLQASYPGGDLDDLLIQLAESNPTGVSLVADPSAAGRATLEWTPTAGTSEGLHLIQIDISDSTNPERQGRVVVQVIVGQPNQAPILVAVDRQQAIVDQPFVLQLEATDLDAPGFDLRYQFGNDAPPGARINRVTGLLQWEPTSVDAGTHAFEITVQDQGRPNLTTTVTVTIDVLPANIGPTITAPSIVPIDEDLPFQFTAGGTSLSVADPDSQATQLQLTIVATEGQFTLENTDGLQLVVGDSVSGPTPLATLRGTAAALNGALDRLTFQPDTDFHGTATLRLELDDLGNGGLQPALAASHSIALPVAPTIDLPTLAPQTFTLPSWFLSSDVAGTVVAGNPDPEALLRYEVTAGNSDQALAIDVVTGTISVANEEFLSPGDLRVLTVRVFYAVAPLFLAEAPITIQIAPNSNRAPSIGWDNYTLDEDATIAGNLILGDSQGGVADTDPDGDPLLLVEARNQEGHSLPLGEANRLSSGAMLTLLADGSMTYDASSSGSFDAKYFGTSYDRFTYTIADSYGRQQTATVNLTVQHLNDLHVVEDVTLAIRPAASFYDLVGRITPMHTEPQENLSYAIVGGDPDGVFSIDGSGEIRVFDETALAAGQQHVLQIDVVDQAARTVTATATVLVVENRPPVAVDQRYRTAEDVPRTGNVLADNTTGAGWSLDPDPGQALTLHAIDGHPIGAGTSVTLASGARIQMGADGSFFYDPSMSVNLSRLGAGEVVTESISLTVRDPLGAEDTARLLIDVEGRDSTPVARDNAYEITSSERLSANVLVDPGPGGIDTDPDATDSLRLASVDGVAVTGSTTFVTRSGATLTVQQDGSFGYDPRSIADLANLDAGTRFHDAFVYRARDTSGRESNRAVVNVTVLVDWPRASAGIDVVALSLQDDTGPLEGDFRTEDPRLRGTLGGVLLDADHFNVEFDVDAAEGTSGFAAVPTADATMTLYPADAGFPDFPYDPRSSGQFSTEPGRKVIAYRVRALDSTGQTITHDVRGEGGIVISTPAESPWRYIEFELLDPPDQGAIRVAEEVRLYDDTGTIDEENPGAVDSDRWTNDPRLYGVIHGDFTDRLVRVEFEYVRDSAIYRGQIEQTAAGSFLYDPRDVDPGLADLTVTLTVDYRIVVVDTTGGLPDVTLLEDSISFTHTAPPASNASVILAEETGDRPGYLGTSRTVVGTVSGTEQDQVFVEFDHADASGLFDGLPEGEVTAVRQATASEEFEFRYLAHGLPGIDPQVRARVREWSAAAGTYLYGIWSTPLTLSPPQVPGIARLESEALLIGGRSLPRLIGYLEGAVADSETTEPRDLADVSFLTIEFFHHDDPLTETTPVDGTVITDAQGGFEYVPSGLAYGATSIQARSVQTLPGTTEKIHGPVASTTIFFAPPKIPTLATDDFGLMVPEVADYQYVDGEFRWITVDPRVTGTLTPDDSDGIGIEDVWIEFAHDDQAVVGDEEQVVGYAQADRQGEFFYRPFALPTGNVRLRARVTYDDDLTSTPVPPGPWVDLVLQVETPSNVLATVEDLALVAAVDDGSGDPPRTTNPTITGRVSDAGGDRGFVTVELRDRTTETPLGTATTDAAGVFVFVPTDLPAGTVAIEARAQEWDYQTQQVVFGPWTEPDDVLTFVVDTPAPLAVTDFDLASDTGISQNDRLTANGLLVGHIDGDGSVEDVTIALDWAADGTIDATARTDAAGEFSFQPVGLGYGAHTVRASVARWSPETGVFDYSTGLLTSFTLEPQPNAAAKIVAFALADPPDAGAPVRDPTLVGRLINESTLEGITVEVDFDTDDLNGFNQSTTTDLLGNFRLLATSLPAGTAILRARTRETDATNGQVLVGNWVTLPPFEYEPPNSLPANLIDFGLAFAPDDPGPPPVTTNSRVFGHVSNDGPLEDVVVEFSWSEDGPVVGTALPSSFDGSFLFDPLDLVAGEVVTLWARAKKPSDADPLQFLYGDSLGTTFQFVPAGPTGLHIVGLSLVEDTSSPGGSSNDDGSTSDSRMAGTIAGISELDGQVVQFDLDRDGTAETTTTTDAQGQFEHDLALSVPGYYTIRARVEYPDSFATSDWQTVNFVFDTNDSSSRALALVAAFAAIDPDWQTADQGFDHEGAVALAESTYQNSLDNADANYDFQVAVAELARRSEQQLADGAYEQGRAAARQAYEEALGNAQVDFLAALDTLPAVDRATYATEDFVWPDAPDGGGLVIPDDATQPPPPPAPITSGPAFDPARDPVYGATAAQAEQTYLQASKQSQQQYRQEVEALGDADDEEKQTVQEAYRQAVEEAHDRYDALREDRPQFDDDAYQEQVELVRQAWRTYRDAVDQHYERYASVTANAAQKLSDRLNSTYADEVDAQQRARDDAYDEHDGHNGGWTFSEDRALKLEIYRIDKRFAPIYEEILNEHTVTIEEADRERSIANANALRTALGTVYAAQQTMAEMNRDYLHEKLVARLDDSHQLTVDLADANVQLQDDLAQVQATRMKRVADAAYDRDTRIADARRTYDQTMVTARKTAVEGWALAMGTVWADYQVDLASNEETYSRQLAERAHARDLADNEATREKAYGLADAVATQSAARAEAERTRTIALSEARLQLRIDSDAEYTARDNGLTRFWRDQRLTIADARLDHAISTENSWTDASIAVAESWHAYATAMPSTFGFAFYAYGWAYDIWASGYTSHALDAEWKSELIIDNQQTRDDLTRTRQRQQVTIERDRILAREEADITYDEIRIDAIATYRFASNEAFYDTTVAMAEIEYSYQTDVADAQDATHRTTVAADASYLVDRTRAESASLYANAEADANYTMAELPLNETRQQDDAVAGKVYQVVEASAHGDRIAIWAGAALTRWEAYQSERAQAELDAVTARGDAEIARIQQRWAANSQWVRAVASANLAYARQLNGNQGAAIERVETIADATLTRAAKRSVASFAESQADATRRHDLDVASANLDLYNVLAETDATRDHAVSQAIHLRHQTVARADYEFTKPDGISQEEWSALIDEANARQTEQGALANAERMTRVAEARRQWTVDVGSLNVQLVKDVVAAQQQQSKQAREDMVEMATTVAVAQWTYVRREAEARERVTVETAAAEVADQASNGSIDAETALRSGAVASQRLLAETVARGNFEVGLHADYLAATTELDNQAGTPSSRSWKEIAERDYAWSVARASAGSLYQQAISGIEADRTSVVGSAESDRATRAGTTRLELSAREAASDRRRAANLALADANLSVAKAAADADRLLAVTDTQGSADIDYAKAVRRRDNAYADGAVVWIRAIARAEVDAAVGEITWQQRSDLRADADRRRQDAKEAADEAFEQATDDTGTDAQEKIGAARIAHVEQIGTATRQHAASAGRVENRYAVEMAQASVDEVVARALSTQQFEQERLSADLRRAAATDAQDVLRLERLRDAAVTGAAGRAAAEATFLVAQAEQAADTWRTLANVNPADTDLRQTAARRAAQAAWFAALETDHVAQQTAVARATRQQTIDLAVAAAARGTTRTLAETRNRIESGIWTGRREANVIRAESDHALASVRRANRLRNEGTHADQRHAAARVEADVNYDQANDAIGRDYRDDPLGSEADEARDQANRQRDEAFADADLDWRLAIAGAEYRFAVGKATADTVRTMARADAEQTFRTQTVRSEAMREMAFAEGQRPYLVAETVTNNRTRESLALADTDFLTAQYGASSGARDDMISALPRVSGSTFDIDSGYATGQLTFQANVWNGAADPGEFFVGGSALVTHDGQTIDLGAIDHGIAVDDGATGTGYILLSAESLATRFAANPPRLDASDRLIAVRRVDGQWQYNDDTPNWFTFAPDTGDLLVAEVDFSSDTVVSWGGFSRWAIFSRDRAQAKANAWEDVKDDYLQWQRDMSTALSDHAFQRGSAHVTATVDSVVATQAFRIGTAQAVAQQVANASAAQHNFAMDLAERTFQYRQRVASAEHRLAIGQSDPDCDPSCQTDLEDQRSDAIAVAEEAFRTDYEQLNGQRQSALASAGVTLTGATGELNIQLASRRNAAQGNLAVALVDAYFGANDGLERTLAELEYDYEREEAAVYATAIDSLASDSLTPWAQLAQAEAVARRDQLVEPVAALARDQRLDLAAADRQYHLQVSTVQLDQSLASVQAAAGRAFWLASASFANLGATPAEEDSVDLPTTWRLPTPDLGEVAPIDNDYAVTQPGRIGDGWYDANWSWYGMDTYYWSATSRYSWLWRWSYIVGPYGGYDYYGQWWYGGYGYYDPWWYGGGSYGAYGAGAFAWNGWSPNYLGRTTGVDTHVDVDVQGTLGAYRQTLEELLSPGVAVRQAAANDQDPAPPRIDPASGYLALGDANVSFDSVAAGFAEASEIASDMIAFSRSASPRRTASDLRSLSMELADEMLPKNMPDVIVDVSQAGEQRLADEFAIAVRGSRVIYRPVIATIYGLDGRPFDQYGQGTVLGVLDDLGWVQIIHELGGGRATFSSLEKAASQWSTSGRRQLVAALGNIDPGHKKTTLQELIDGVRSPYQIDATSNSIGVFIDGTGSHLYAVSNVIRLYNLYDGTKFFYGGIGNHVDTPMETVDGAVAVITWQTILRRAEADVVKWARELGANAIHLFGFSRGAAQAIELANRLGKHGLRVDFLGLFDPVYSVSDPGVTSDYLEPTDRGSVGNYGERQLPDNVDAATVIYAMNETRTFFPATRLVDKEGGDPANVTSIGAPGVHSDVGGHFGNNLNIQQLTLATMVHYAQAQSSVSFSNKALDGQLWAAYRSTYTAFMVVRDSGKEGAASYAKFLTAQRNWNLTSASDYRIKAGSQSFNDWFPGPVGVQNGTEFWTGKKLHKIGGIAKELLIGNVGELYDEVFYQNSADFIVRNLDWVRLGLWDTYSGIDSTFMRKLYGYFAHPKGGWRSTLGRGEVPRLEPARA